MLNKIVFIQYIVGCMFDKAMIKNFTIGFFPHVCYILIHLSIYWLKSQLHNKVESVRKSD